MKNRPALIATIAVLGLLSAGARAAPGWESTQFAVSPQDAPKIVAAMDAFMAGSGEDYPGQVTLLMNEADGANPATHTILQTYPSVAANEAFSQKVQSDRKVLAEWMKVLEVFASVATPAQTTRGRFLRNWGDVDPSDTVWMHHFLSVSPENAPAVVAAIDRWMNSSTGKRAPGQLHLSAVVAGGLDSPSHVVSIGNASQAEAEQWQDSIAGNADFQAFVSAMTEAAEYRGANLSIEVKSWGEAPVPGQ